MNVSTPLTHDSLAKIDENALIERLVGDPYWRRRMLNVKGIRPDAQPYLRVSLDGLPGEPKGDIDILLVPPDRPDLAAAIQAKRVKVTESAFNTGMPGKLTELGKLKKQANVLADLGFALIYCFVLIVVDSRHRNVGGDGFEGLTTGLRGKIDGAVSSSGLEPRVGLLQFEFAQPTDAEPLMDGSSSTRLRRLAIAATQPSEVTEWVRRTMEARRA